MKFFNAYRKYVLMDEAGDGTGAGSGTGGGSGDKGDEALAGAQKTIAELTAKLEALSKSQPKGDDDLSAIAEKNRKEAEAKKGQLKSLEKSIQFDMKSKEWLKTNESLLPKNLQSIFDAADKETFESVVDKTSAVKSSIVQEFFSVQENLDLLTESQKNKIAEYLKLTKNVKQERAGEVFDELFEPTFEMLKRIKKAELLNSGYAASGDAEKAYENKMIAISQKQYLGDKKDA